MLPQRTDKKFAAALKESRESRNLSYAELARQVGITQKNIPNYENKGTIPSQKTWEKLDAVFNSNNNLTKEHNKRIYLNEASVEKIIDELKSRGITNLGFN